MGLMADHTSARRDRPMYMLLVLESPGSVAAKTHAARRISQQEETIVAAMRAMTARAVAVGDRFMHMGLQ